jgi:hypothetical protein
MNDTRNETPRDDAHWFDLLVDGELDDERRRELLSRLDDQPGGWRKCALAFLEAQTWRRELGDWVTDAKAQAPAMPAAAVQARSRPWGLGSWLVVAASFVMAFGLGLYLRDLARPAFGPGPGQLAVDDARQPPALDAGLLAQQEYGSPALPGGGVMTMSFRPDPDGQLHELQVPFVDDPSVSPERLARPSPAIPLEVLRDLQRSGHRVEQSRQLLPFDLPDGRRGVVPVDRVNVHYVGNGSYQ